jgi:hypothetical protein
MIEVIAIHPDGHRERVSLETEAQVATLQQDGVTLIRLSWSEALKKSVTVPEHEQAS